MSTDTPQFGHTRTRYGNNAITTKALFSQGILWRISLISYNTPVPQSATGTTSSFAIPTQFRGDQLATVEAKYADGSNAGPANRTSFKEFPTTPQARPR